MEMPEKNDVLHIEKVNELIYQYTGRSKTIVKTNISRLTVPGENYCSLMLKLDVTLKSIDNDDEEVMHAVAKCRNKTDSDYFNYISPLQFKKEIGFYTEIVPALESLQNEQGVKKTFNIFPKVLAFRRNLHGFNQEIDDHAVILFENLKRNGFSNIERQIGFDLQGAEHLIEDIAILHALPVALKLLKPDIFERTVLTYALHNDEFKSAPKGDFIEPVFLKVIEEEDECKPYLDLVRKLLNDTVTNNTFFDPPVTEPFATIIHSDLWVNNTMQIIERGKIVQNKIIDFQNFQYGNPMLDVVVFLFSSVQKQVVKDHLEKLIDLYEYRFFKVLEDLKCDISSMKRNFLEQMVREAQGKLIHVLYLIIPIFSPERDCALDYKAQPSDMIKESSVTQQAKDQIRFVVTEYAKRGWIKLEK